MDYFSDVIFNKLFFVALIIMLGMALIIKDLKKYNEFASKKNIIKRTICFANTDAFKDYALSGVVFYNNGVIVTTLFTKFGVNFKDIRRINSRSKKNRLLIDIHHNNQLVRSLLKIILDAHQNYGEDFIEKFNDYATKKQAKNLGSKFICTR